MRTRTTGSSTMRGGTTMPALTVLAAVAATLALAPPVAAQQQVGPATGRAGDCAAGQLCLWERPGFAGPRHTFELSDTDIESCVALPAGARAASLANRTGRPVTTYQSAECAETGEYDTYPGKGSGTRLAQSPYQIRAVKIWER